MERQRIDEGLAAFCEAEHRDLVGLLVLLTMAQLDGDVSLYVGLLPKPFGVEVEAVGDLGWSWFG